MKLNEVKTLGLVDVTQTINSETINIDNAKTIAIVANIVSDSPTAKTFVADPTTDQLAITAHGYKTGLKGQVSTTLVLPGGLAMATDYFIIVVDANTVKLATSHANALAGTAIDITSAGTGVQTFTATALAGGLVTVQYSLDQTTYIDLAAGTAITASSVFSLNIVDPAYPYLRLRYALTAGQLTLTNKIAIKI